MEKEIVEVAAASAAVAADHRETTTMGQLKEKVVRTSAVSASHMQKQESKWKTAIMRRKERLNNEIERKRREEKELESMKEAAQIQHQMSINFPKFSREAVLKEKQQRVEELKKEKLQLKIKTKAQELRRRSEQRTWLYIIKQIKNLQAIAKAEKDIEKERALTEAEERQKKYRDEWLAKRKKQKVEDKKWKRRMSQQIKQSMEKRRKKRNEERKNATVFVSRFRKLQLEQRKRKRKEKMRELQEEELRLQEKKKKQEKELIRRAEVAARLNYMKKVQELNDTKRLGIVEKLRREHKAECAVYEAQKKIMKEIVDEIKKHSDKISLQHKKKATEKYQTAYNLKKRREAQRRVAVSTALARYRKHARALAEHRTRQLADEETRWQLRKQNDKAFNQWVRECWSDHAKRMRERDLLHYIKEQDKKQQQQQSKKEIEQKRRERVAHRIQYYQQLQRRRSKISYNDVQSNTGGHHRFLHFQHSDHVPKISVLQSERLRSAERTRLEFQQERYKYQQDREKELQHSRNKKKHVLKKATQRAWR